MRVYVLRVCARNNRKFRLDTTRRSRRCIWAPMVLLYICGVGDYDNGRLLVELLPRSGGTHKSRIFELIHAWLRMTCGPACGGGSHVYCYLWRVALDNMCPGNLLLSLSLYLSAQTITSNRMASLGVRPFMVIWSMTHTSAVVCVFVCVSVFRVNLRIFCL